MEGPAGAIANTQLITDIAYRPAEYRPIMNAAVASAVAQPTTSPVDMVPAVVGLGAVSFGHLGLRNAWISTKCSSGSRKKM